MEAGVLGGGLASTPHAVAVTQRETCLSSEPLVPASPGGGGCAVTQRSPERQNQADVQRGLAHKVIEPDKS